VNLKWTSDKKRRKKRKGGGGVRKGIPMTKGGIIQRRYIVLARGRWEGEERPALAMKKKFLGEEKKKGKGMEVEKLKENGFVERNGKRGEEEKGKEMGTLDRV